MKREEDRALNKLGQSIGSKGDRSRQRIMDAALEVLKKKRIWEVSVTDICVTCGIAPSNLYTYFSGVNEVVLELARQVTARQPPIAAMLEGSWEGRSGLARARKVVKTWFDYWDEYRPVLKVVELLADEGNREFMEVRDQRLFPLHAAMRPLVQRSQAEGRINRKMAPGIIVISAVALIDSAAMHMPIVMKYGHDYEDALETQARLLLLHLTGRDGSGER